MKAFFFTILFLLGLNSQAYNITTDVLHLPSKIIDAVRASFDQKCKSISYYTQELKLLESKATSDDTGTKYDLVFIIVSPYMSLQRPDKLFLTVKQGQGSEGQVEIKTTHFKTESGADFDAICEDY